jgi:hypothetical protein
MTRVAAALVALLVALLAGCTAGGGASPVPATTVPTAVPVTPSPAPPSVEPSAPASEGPVAATEFTPDDEEIARIISGAVDEAIPQLKVLNDSDPSKLEDLFVPLGDWITSQRTSVESMTPSSCTVEAVALFEDGLDQYDAIRKKFLAWRDWGANGNAFPPGAPREAADTLQAAVDELGATCSS